MKLKVIKDKCISCGYCVSCYDESFAFDDNNKAICTHPEVESTKEEEMKKLIQACPGEAIVED